MAGRRGLATLSASAGAAVLVALAIAAGAGARPALVPGGHWSSAPAIQKLIISQPLTRLLCPPKAGPAGCTIDSNGTPMGYAGYSIKVTSATVTGMGSVKRIKGRPNYQLFEVKVCGVNFLTGNGVPLGAHFLWHTSRLSAAAAAAYKKLAGQVNALHQLIVTGQASPAQQKQAQELGAKLQAVRAQNASKAAYAEDWDQRNHVQPIFHDGCQ